MTQKILIIQTAFIGDAILAAGVLRLRKQQLLAGQSAEPTPETLEEIPRRLAVRVLGFEDENNQVAGRNKLFGDLLVVFYDGVRSRRVDDGNFPQDVDR